MHTLAGYRAALAALVAAPVIFTSDAARSQAAAGDWHGTIEVPSGAQLRIGITVKPKAGGGYDGVLQSPDQTPAPIPLDGVQAADGLLSFSIDAFHASYTGHWDGARQAWVGTWRQGAPLPLVLTAGKPDPLPVIEGLDGDWAGAITPAGATVRLILHIRTDSRGTIVTLDSPDQGAFDIPLRTLKRDSRTVTFEINGSRFEGILSADGRSIVGAWAGVAYKGPLTFASRPVATLPPKRPQTPQPPFPYRTEAVVVQSAPGVKLAGTLTLPQGKGPFPAAVLITGSGAQDRDETILGHKPFAVIADRLTRDGIAVLRVDDRGFGQSTGDFASATDDDFAVDAAANVAFLRGRGDIDPTRIGLIGHSEGGLVAPKVAARDPKLAFIVLMAGPGVPLSQVLRAQRAAMAPAMGVSPERIRRSQALLDDVNAAMRGARDEADARDRALKVIQAEGGEAIRTPAQAMGLAVQLSSGWMRGLLDYDPAPTLARVKCPILALNGSKDEQVPPDQNLPAIRAATKANPDVAIVELPGLNHMFQTAKTGALGEYADIEETVAPIALDTISTWVRRHVAK
ncbi:alpha/beta hydrolase family protein [Caulobacter sp. KR2-114]|uniref:alpha/beta hydrolase family protein n=1 Tax=Caulobacter sp. KR2-114 TaxID=3400912 RepID=UPI003C0DE9C0